MTDATEIAQGNQGRDRSLRIGAGFVALAVILAVVVFAVVLAQDNAYKADAEAACIDDVESKYHDRDATVFARFEGRDGDRLEFSAVDTLAEFHWTCFVTKGDDGPVVDSFK